MNTEGLATTIIRLYLAHLILCHDDFGKDDVAFWAALLEGEEGAMGLCCEVMAYRQAKARLRESKAGNPHNVVAVLLYNVSHTGRRDPQASAMWQERLDAGFSLKDVTRPDQALALIDALKGAHLSERQIGLLLGRVVNLDRVTKLIIEEYEKLGEESNGN